MTAAVGLAPWRPNAESKLVVVQIAEILHDNREYLPMTARQIFYRLVGAYGFPKTEQAYGRLLDKLNRARRARMIPFHAIRDDGVAVRGGGGWSSPEEWISSLIPQAKGYRRDRQEGQAEVLEVWVEAQGMVPQVARVAGRYGISVYSSGGFNSTTMKHRAAQRIIWQFSESKRPTRVLHVGDHDPSGVAIFDNLRTDIPAMVEDLVEKPYGYALSRWDRIAVTGEQIETYGLEESPPKASDSRSKNWRGGTVQVESMSPPELAAEIEQSILAHVNVEAYEAVLAAEDVERDVLVRKLERLTEGASG